jgi:hypothetical protein
VLTCLHAIVIGAVLLEFPLAAQVSPRARAFAQLAEPPIPSDPLELVTGNAQPVQDINQRAEIINLLATAHQNSNVRSRPYDMKTTFTVSGALSAGAWQEEDTSPSGGRYRWTVQGPSYSALNMTGNRVFYTNQASISLPLRLIQVRGVLFRMPAVVGSRATLRTANASLNGVDVVCALVAHNATAPAGTGGRQWEEEEYCVDPKTNTLLTFSESPGSYVVFDYSKSLQFHGKLIANGFTITQAGQTIVEAQTASVTDPANDPAAFQTAGLNQMGVGPAMSAAWQFHMRLPLPNGAPGGTSQIVVLHGMQAPSGQLSDVEVLASSDASLNESALAFASNWQRGLMGQETENVTPQSHEIVLTLQYANLQALVSPPQ